MKEKMHVSGTLEDAVLTSKIFGLVLEQVLPKESDLLPTKNTAWKISFLIHPLSNQ